MSVNTERGGGNGTPVVEVIAGPARALVVALTAKASPCRRRRLKDLFITTNLVVGETIALILTTPPRIHAAAVKAGEYLFAEKIARVRHVTAEEEREAFEYFKRHQDKEYSFTDCTSFVLMERLGMREALALDSDFTHRFIACPGPRPK